MHLGLKVSGLRLIQAAVKLVLAKRQCKTTANVNMLQVAVTSQTVIKHASLVSVGL